MNYHRLMSAKYILEHMVGVKAGSAYDKWLKKELIRRNKYHEFYEYPTSVALEMLTWKRPLTNQ